MTLREMLLLDADANAQEIVDTASVDSFTSLSAPRHRAARTAVNICPAAALMGRGKSVLVVGESAPLRHFRRCSTGIEEPPRYDLLAEHNAEAQRAEFIRANVRK